jgi:hypothetical protein
VRWVKVVEEAEVVARAGAVDAGQDAWAAEPPHATRLAVTVSAPVVGTAKRTR